MFNEMLAELDGERHGPKASVALDVDECSLLRIPTATDPNLHDVGKGSQPCPRDAAEHCDGVVLSE